MYICSYVYMYTGIPCNITRNVAVTEGSVVATFSSGNPGTIFTCRLDANIAEPCKYIYMYCNFNSNVIVKTNLPYSGNFLEGRNFRKNDSFYTALSKPFHGPMK